MKLKTTEIINYRKFKNVTINYLENITVIAGANNSGKTSLVQFLNYVFSNINHLGIKDINIDNQLRINEKINEIATDLYNCYNKCKYKDSCQTDESNFINKLKGNDLQDLFKIMLNIEVTYEDDTDISLFSDYLMDLDDNTKSFYFQFSFEIDKKILDDIENIEYLGKNIEQIFKDYEGKVDVNEEKIITKIITLITNFFEESYSSNYYYTNADYSITIPMKSSDFRKLFHYDYIYASRNLADDVNAPSSLSAAILEFMSTSENTTLNELYKNIEKSLNESVTNSEIDKELKTKTKEMLDVIINNMSFVGGGNLSNINMMFDYSEEYGVKIIKDLIKMKYLIEEDGSSIFLDEKSQGLGVSNLIYLVTKVQRFRSSYSSGKVNFFIIEEPEAHLHMQMEKVLMTFLLEEFSKDNMNIQGLISTHSSEIVKAVGIEKIKVIRKESNHTNKICDLRDFISKTSDKSFYETMFRLNFSNIIFADKAIFFEGDTERMYIESIISNLSNNPYLKDLSGKYISYIQVGGAYAEKYFELINELGIKSVIFTDIDYGKDVANIEDVNDSKSTNSTLNSVMRIISSDEDKNTQGDISSEDKDVVDLTTSNEDDNSKDGCIKNIYSWQQRNDRGKFDSRDLIRVYTQTKHEGYARSLEDALLFNILKNEKMFTTEDNVFKKLERDEWKTTFRALGIKIVLPKKTKEYSESDIASVIESSVREMARALSNSKSDFMYSIILSDIQEKIIPNYIKEGLQWINKE